VQIVLSENCRRKTTAEAITHLAPQKFLLTGIRLPAQPRH